MKKILIVTNHSYMLYRFRKELIAALMQEHEVVLSMPFVGHEEDFRAMGLRCVETQVDRRGINPKTDFKLLCDYDKLIRTERPDMVITYSIKPNIYANLVCQKYGIPYYANVQGLGTAFQKKGLAQFVTLLYRAALRKARCVFFENSENARLFVERDIIPEGKVTLLHGAGVNLEEYGYQPYPENEVSRFLYLGRLMREKGIDELFGAARRLNREGERFVLDLVGFFEDAYKEQVEQLQADGIAVFHGFQEDPKPYYTAADCVVMPSYHEGMSNVNLEGAAIGRPVITTDIPGCKEAVEHGRTGFLCTVKSEDALYEVMKQFLKLPREQREAMGLQGRKKVEREFSKEAVVDETVRAIYQRA